ncbi:MAG: SprT-like domain-containing protein [Lishizhenia sp.]
MSNKKKVQEQLKKFIPEQFTPLVADLIFSEKVKFRVSKPRKTKLGDYRSPRLKSDYHQISVNSNLNAWSFLITTLHEFAHMHTYIQYGNRVKSHGVEWKKAFQVLLNPLIDDLTVPNDVRLALKNTVAQTTASSCTDLRLTRVLRRYDTQLNTKVVVEELQPEELFELNNKIYQRGNLRRKRYLCKEINTGKLYLVHCLALVNKVNTKNGEK